MRDSGSSVPTSRSHRLLCGMACSTKRGGATVTDRTAKWLCGGLGLLSLIFLGKGTWIYVKAELAQILLERAWAATKAGENEVRPWDWADTWPVARLRAPRLDVSRLVLDGATGRTLAFGPGHLLGSARPGARGNTVLAGHRDTHIAFLNDLEQGDPLWLETPDGEEQLYRVETMSVVERSRTDALEPTADAVLTLVTCYPFDAVLPGGPLRYVVRAGSSE